ncbi:MAG: transposase [Thermodesulfobacteriota bacterium]|nr:transposase [Thermodesulfobacteriota bacterium]
MPRKARIDAPGALYHIIIRGIEWKNIFLDDGDRNNFLERLGNLLIESSTACYAWALIPNHVHILLRAGAVPLATVMRRLLTGYAVTYNRRHKRHGQLFQNRYKSVLCQEKPYFLQLIRYIHLNPLRAKIIQNVKDLDTYHYTGHSVIMGKRENSWQDVDYVLQKFHADTTLARKMYLTYVWKGIQEGQRYDLIGGGLIRSAGGWSRVKALRKRGDRLKGDERILGDSSFVSEVLQLSAEQLDRRHHLKIKGYDLRKLGLRVASLFGIEPEQIYTSGKYPDVVKSRSVFCYWAVRELGENATVLAKKLGLSQPAVSISVKRGEKIVRELKLELLESKH